MGDARALLCATPIQRDARNDGVRELRVNIAVGGVEHGDVQHCHPAEYAEPRRHDERHDEQNPEYAEPFKQETLTRRAMMSTNFSNFVFGENIDFAT